VTRWPPPVTPIGGCPPQVTTTAREAKKTAKFQVRPLGAPTKTKTLTRKPPHGQRPGKRKKRPSSAPGCSHDPHQNQNPNQKTTADRSAFCYLLRVSLQIAGPACAFWRSRPQVPAVDAGVLRASPAPARPSRLVSGTMRHKHLYGELPVLGPQFGGLKSVRFGLVSR
jgi:hypothetical protein